MGSSMALRAIRMGMSVVGYNRSKERVQHLKNKIELLSSIREVCNRADVIIVMVSDDKADEDVTIGNRGIFDNIKSGRVVIDSSTISPSLSRKLTDKLRRKRATRIEMPVMGGPSLALRGELVAIIGADRTKYEENLDIIKIFANRIFYAGGAGSALMLKLALNFLIAAYAEAIAEGLSFVKKAGLDPMLLIQILNATAYKTAFSETKAINMVKENFEPTFYLKHMAKDLNIASITAYEIEAFMPALSTLKEIYRGACNSGLADLDYSAVAKFLAELNSSKR